MGSSGALLLAVLLLWPFGPAAAQTGAPKVTVGHGLSMYGDLKYGPELQALRVRQPGSAQGRGRQAGGHRHLRHAEPLHPQGRAGGRRSAASFDTLTVAVGRRAVLRVRAHRREHRDAGRPLLGRLHAPAAGALPRRQPHHGRGRDLDVRDAQDEGPSLLPVATTPRSSRPRRWGSARCGSRFGPGDNRELPLIVGQLPVLSRAYWSKRDFEKTTLEPPLGSGAYRVESVEPGRSITYRRVKDYWAREAAGERGPGQLRLASATTTTATSRWRSRRSRAGEYDFRQENVAKNWATAYATPAVTHGPHQEGGDPERGPHRHAGVRVQHAAADLPGSARAPGAGLRVRLRVEPTRTSSTAPTRGPRATSRTPSWPRSGLPGPEELKILEPFRGKVPDEVFTQEYQPPVDRRQRQHPGRRARGAATPRRGRLDRQGPEAGQRPTGEPMQFEILLGEPDLGADRAALREEPRAARRHRACPDGRHRPVPEAAGRLRLRHDRRPSGRSRSRPATSSATSGGPQAAGEPGQPEPRRHQRPGGGQAHRPGRRGARTARAWSPAPARSTACCCGATTSSRTGTSGPSASPTGTSSAGRPSRRSTRSASTPGGSTRRRRRRSPAARARSPSSRAARRCSPTSSAVSC